MSRNGFRGCGRRFVGGRMLPAGMLPAGMLPAGMLPAGMLTSAVMLLTAVMPGRALAADMKLGGTVIGTEWSVDYTTGAASLTANSRDMAFDGDPSTCFASFDRSFTWVGLDLDRKCVITKVGWMARNDGLGPGRMQLGVFQGANNEDFSDAVPIYLIPEPGVIGEMTYAEVNCSRGFRYVRYVGPHDARCNVAELEFYGHIGAGDDSQLYQVTNLPTVVVNTPGMEWFNGDKEYAMEGSTITIINDGEIDVSALGQIRGRGNASWGFPKKPFRIKFDKKQKVLGGPAKAKKWTMINNYGDKTLMRNRLAFDISERLGMDFTPACHFVDLVFNGEYQGCYQLCDQVEVNPGRVEITEMEPTDTEGEALTGGYLVEIDAYASQEAYDEWFQTYRGYSLPVTIKSPDPGVTEQYNYICDAMSDLSARVKAYNFKDPDEGFRRRLDLDSFLKHFIVGELSGNMDTYWSVYMSLDRGCEKFKTGPCWDFDLAFENDQRIYPVNDKPDFIYLYGSHAGEMKPFVNRIVKEDPEARNRLSYLWSYARKYSGLDFDTFAGLVDQYAAQLAQSQRLNFLRWPILNEYVHQNPMVWGTYEAEVNNVRNYLYTRFSKLDNLIGLVEVSETPEITREPENDGDCMVFSLQGICVGNTLDGLAPGIYIVKKGTKTEKIRLNGKNSD